MLLISLPAFDGEYSRRTIYINPMYVVQVTPGPDPDRSVLTLTHDRHHHIALSPEALNRRLSTP